MCVWQIGKSLRLLFVLCSLFSCLRWSSIVLLLFAVMGVRNDLISVIFFFPTRRNERKKWKVFRKRPDKKFMTLCDPRICSLHWKATSRFQFLVEKVYVQAAIRHLWPNEVGEYGLRSKHLADRKRQCDEQLQAEKVCPRNLDFEDSIETCVDFSADVTSVNHDHSLLQPGTGNTEK